MEETKQRIVVKVGTSTLTHDSGTLDLRSMEHLVRVLADLSGAGHEIILVTSGAIAVGTARLDLAERPTELRMKQAAAAVGQCRMMHIYDKLFSEYNRSMAQILLTGDDVEDPQRAEHLRSTFSALLEMRVIPVVNENDSVSSAEIETGHHKVLGDNDTLSAIVAELCRADLLVLFSDIDGLYDADPRTHPRGPAPSPSDGTDAGDPGDGRRRRQLAGHRRHGHQALRRPDRHGRGLRHGHHQRPADGGPVRHREGPGHRDPFPGQTEYITPRRALPQELPTFRKA